MVQAATMIQRFLDNKSRGSYGPPIQSHSLTTLKIFTSLLTVLVSGPDQKMSQHCFECVNQDEPPAMDEDQDEETMDW